MTVVHISEKCSHYPPSAPSTIQMAHIYQNSFHGIYSSCCRITILYLEV